MLLVAIYAALPPSLQGGGAGWSRWVEVAVSHHGDAGTAKSRPAKRTMDAIPTPKKSRQWTRERQMIDAILLILEGPMCVRTRKEATAAGRRQRQRDSQVCRPW